MNKKPIKVVIHDAYGGFHLTKEMVELMKAKGFDWEKYNITEDHLNQSYGDDIYVPDHDNFDFRSDPILVETVKKLQDNIRHLTAYEIRQHYISKLKVVEIYPPTIYIEEYHDGHERIMCNGYEL